MATSIHEIEDLNAPVFAAVLEKEDGVRAVKVWLSQIETNYTKQIPPAVVLRIPVLKAEGEKAAPPQT